MYRLPMLNFFCMCWFSYIVYARTKRRRHKHIRLSKICYPLPFKLKQPVSFVSPSALAIAFSSLSCSNTTLINVDKEPFHWVRFILHWESKMCHTISHGDTYLALIECCIIDVRKYYNITVNFNVLFVEIVLSYY